MPHAVTMFPAAHTFPLQQPLGQLVGLQTQAPATHACPVPQAGLVPHLQPPPAQLSEVAGSQGMHAAPGAPHFVALGGTQLPPSQQPPGQLVALH